MKKTKRINPNKLLISRWVYVFVFFLFLLFSGVLCYRCLANPNVGEVTFSEFIKNRNIYEETLMPSRGTIYDSKGNVLAQDVSSYTLIAYLDESRSEGSDTPLHVVDKEATAKTLSEYIDTSYERILEILNKDAYQVEFGSGGKNLSQLEMETIKDLNLPGIDFIKTTKRYYPNGDFASYLLGYTVTTTDDEGNTWEVGELGIEASYNDVLTGTSGYITYEKDGRGNKIANSNEYIEEAVDGADVTLTIDSSVQLFVEEAVKESQEESNAEWTFLAVMDAKTGAILGYASSPSFDPNLRNLTNYLDPLVSYTYEPGSTMKTYTYMCAIESGKYDGNATFMSGSKTYTSAKDEFDTTTIKDWNGIGWGEITFDFGYAMSSNIGVATLLEEVITKQELSDCLEEYGFGKVTGITLNHELSGNIKFTYDVEAATAAYGQGITITPIQMLQGLTIVANDGEMLKPYIVSKVTSSTGEVLEKTSRTSLGQVVSSTTTDKIKTLMRSVVNKDSSLGTGYAYYMEGYDLIGKTGTASIFENGKYLTGSSDYIYSFAGMYPGDDPEIIIYMVNKKPQSTKNYLAQAVKEITVNLSKYYNIEEATSTVTEYTLSNYQNMTTTTIADSLKSNQLNVVTLGTGSKIISQYPQENTTLHSGDTVFLLTNDYNQEMINLIDLSYKDVINVLDMMGVSYNIEGNGYVYEQSILPGTVVSGEVTVKLKDKY